VLLSNPSNELKNDALKTSYLPASKKNRVIPNAIWAEFVWMPETSHFGTHDAFFLIEVDFNFKSL
jgi:hypothetical protein